MVIRGVCVRTMPQCGLAKALCTALESVRIVHRRIVHGPIERDSMKLQDKVTIVTGAGRGIGRATAIKFASEGAKVVVCDLSPDSVEETTRLCKEAGGDAMGFIADVRDIKALEAM